MVWTANLLKLLGTPAAQEPEDEFLCAKMHLVDLAGSERLKRTGMGPSF